MDTGIPEFFKNKTVFLTGGSGFLGKVVTEKLLRTTEVKRIYSLIRPKRGVSIGERTSAWEKEPVFALLLKSQPKALQRVCPIAGDCLKPDLGISEWDRKLLVSEVQIVIHGAATVRFDEALHLALAINVRAARLMLQLAKQMTQLVSFVHVSTAYSNYVAKDIDERFYPEHLKESPDKILALGELLSDETIDSMTTSLLRSFPNTYTYTKALAEDLIRREAGDLPLCIVRPAVIMPTYKEPLMGWMDNLFGPLGSLYAIVSGVMRVMVFNPKGMISLVPADYCVNAVLACAWKTGETPVKRGEAESPPIYTLAPSEKNLISFHTFTYSSLALSHRTPLSKMMWYPMVLCVSPRIFPYVAFFLHTLPGYFLDFLFCLTGRKPFLTKLYRKMHKNIPIITPFATKSFNFGTANSQGLLEAMSQQDRRHYDFDMERLDWQDYLRCPIHGFREYIVKDTATAESIAKALKLHYRLRVLHYGFVISSLSAILYGVWIMAK